LLERVIAAATQPPSPALPEPLPDAVSTAVDSVAGRASVIDGDTIEIHGQRVRLHGIDAPESSQTCRDGTGRDYRCGQRAANYLDQLIGQATVVCQGSDRDRYGRLIAWCETKGIDLSATMAAAGWAVAYIRYSADYVAEEATARGQRAGLWQGEFTVSREWRATHQ
jgi:endonuclease YncB( thermonuclease family)